MASHNPPSILNFKCIIKDMQAETAIARKMRFISHNVRATSGAFYVGSSKQFK